MSEFLKKNILVLAAFAIPMIFIGVVFLVAVVPSLSLRSTYDFVYATCGEREMYPEYCKEYLDKKFSVQDGRIVITNPVYYGARKEYQGMKDDSVEKDRKYEEEGYASRIFLYRAKTGESREISEEEVKNFTLNSLITDPDGISIGFGRGESYGVFPFFETSSSNGVYLKKGNQKKRIHLVDESPNSYLGSYNFHFVGWVEGK